jgi:hypothetical protein
MVFAASVPPERNSFSERWLRASFGCAFARLHTSAIGEILFQIGDFIFCLPAHLKKNWAINLAGWRRPTFQRCSRSAQVGRSFSATYKLVVSLRGIHPRVILSFYFHSAVSVKRTRSCHYLQRSNSFGTNSMESGPHFDFFSIWYCLQRSKLMPNNRLRRKRFFENQPQKCHHSAFHVLLQRSVCGWKQRKAGSEKQGETAEGQQQKQK